MKGFGILLLVAGLVGVIVGLTLKTAVKVPGQDFGFGISTSDTEVHNIGLMDRRRNVLLVSGIGVIIGAIFLTASLTRRSGTDTGADSAPSGSDSSVDSQTKKCPACAEMIKLEAVKCRFCGTDFDPAAVAAAVHNRVDAIKREQSQVHISQEGIPGEAFCCGCRTVGPRSEMLHDVRFGVYYHRKCEPKTDYVSQEGLPGEVSCWGCQKVGPRSQMLHDRISGTYYHRECLPKTGDDAQHVA